MAKTPIDQLNRAISGILSEYAEDIQGNVDQIAEQMGKKGVQALRKEARRVLKPSKSGKSEYTRGWKMQVEKGRLSTKVTIYNEHPGLPHLLEYGHVTRNGTGRTYAPTPAHAHIAPVEKELVQTFEREVVAKL